MLPQWAAHNRVFFDVAHNPNAVVSFFVYQRKECSNTMRRISRKKEINYLLFLEPAKKKMCYHLWRRFSRLLTSFSLFRPTIFEPWTSMKSHNTSATASTPTNSVTHLLVLGILDDGKISSTLQLALAEQKHRNVIICGSFFVMPEAWGFFDKKYLNE